MSRFEHIPGDLGYALEDWSYKGAQPTSRTVGPIMPTVSFSTVDLKMPASGPVKILELNGHNSGLTGYGEERGEASIIGRANQVTTMLGLPVARYLWDADTDDYVEIMRDKHPYWAEPMRLPKRLHHINEYGEADTFHSSLNSLEDQQVRAWLRHRRETSIPGQPRTLPAIQSIEEASMLLELADFDPPKWSNFDPEDAIITNPAEIRLIEKDKLVFDEVSECIGAGKYRPRSSGLFLRAPNLLTTNDIRLQTDIDTVVMKYPEVHGGTGVTILAMEELRALTNLAGRLGSWATMLAYLSGNGFATNQEARQASQNGPLEILLEEYIPSKPIKAPDGAEYDATMRIAIASIANREKVTVVPLGAYWKLPEEPYDMPNSVNASARISRIHEGGSLPVSETDFRRAFRDVADFMKRIIHHTRTTKDTANYWRRVNSQ